MAGVALQPPCTTINIVPPLLCGAQRQLHGVRPPLRGAQLQLHGMPRFGALHRHPYGGPRLRRFGVLLQCGAEVEVVDEGRSDKGVP